MSRVIRFRTFFWKCFFSSQITQFSSSQVVTYTAWCCSMMASDCGTSKSAYADMQWFAINITRWLCAKQRARIRGQSPEARRTWCRPRLLLRWLRSSMTDGLLTISQVRSDPSVRAPSRWYRMIRGEGPIKSGVTTASEASDRSNRASATVKCHQDVVERDSRYPPPPF